MQDQYANYPPELHPANYEMKRNPVGSVQPLASNQIDPQTLATLDQMDATALRSLVQRMARQCGMVACKTEEELRQAFLDRMAHIGLTAKAAEALAAMEKRMDRVEGKPMQRQQSMIAVAEVAIPDDDRIALEHYFKIRGMTNA